MPIVLIWISSLLMSLSPQAIQRTTGFDPSTAPKTSSSIVIGVQHYMQLEFGIKPIPRKRSRREVMAAWLQSVTAD
jgi:hypothetical protein